MTMKYEMKEPSSVRRELQIEIEAGQVSQELERVLGHVAKTARLPGFRRGKVPKPLLRKRFAREIENDLLEHLVPHAVRDALKASGARPVYEPVIKDIELADGAPLRFTATFEVRPHIDPQDYRGVPVPGGEARVEDTQVDREIEALRESAAEYASEAPRPLVRGDFALVDLRATDGGGGEEQAGDQGHEGHAAPREQENVLIEVGGEEYHPEFARNLEGTLPGEERSFTVTYGEDDPDPRARGKHVRYDVRLREVKRKQLPDLDDEFAKDTGKHQSMAELRQAVRGDLEKRAGRDQRRAQEQALMAALVPGLEVEVPQALVEQERERMLEDQVRMLIARGIDPRTAPIDWKTTREKLGEAAMRSVKWELLLDAIADKESIAAADEDVEHRLGAIAESSQKSLEFVRSKIEKDGRMEELRSSVRLEKTVDFLLRNARMERR